MRGSAPSGLAALLGIVVAASTLVACATEPPEDALRATLLTAGDLPGDGWTASTEPVDPITQPQLTCGSLQVNLDNAALESAETGDTVVWTNGEYTVEETWFANGGTSVRSAFARFRYSLGLCDKPDPPGPRDEPQIFIEPSEHQIVARERNYVGPYEDGIIGRADVGVREVGDYVVVIEIGYLEGITPPDVVDLLDIAANNLPEDT